MRKPLNTEPAFRLASAAAISFALTFVGAIVALAAGILPIGKLALGPDLDLGVVLLLAPLGALFLALLVETIRAATGPSPEPRRHARDWRPGHGEG